MVAVSNTKVVRGIGIRIDAFSDFLLPGLLECNTKRTVVLAHENHAHPSYEKATQN